MRILLIDDDLSSLNSVKKYLEKPLGYQVDAYSSATEAFASYQQIQHKIVISDIRMRKMDGLALLRKIKSSSTGLFTDVILMTGYGELSTCMEALREGASDYLLKPISIKKLALVIERVLYQRTLLTENMQLKKEVSQNQVKSEDLTIENNRYLKPQQEIGFFSKASQELYNLALKFHSKPKVNVLIEGETGTGKEIFAKLVHNGDDNTQQPFVSVNCSAISSSLLESELFGYESGAFTGARKGGAKGKFEAAQGGTILLDEIGDMPLEIQPVLLRVIQEREIYRVGGTKAIPLNVRFVFATNKNLKEEVEKGNFRQDLYYRISTGYLKIPPLRERKSEIAPLTLIFIKKYAAENGCDFEAVSRDALYMLQQYYYPGNIRELKSIIERAALLNEKEKVLRIEHLKFLKFSYEMNESDQLNLDLSNKNHTLRDFERIIARKVYKKFNGNVNQGAKFLGIAWATFEKLLR
jgi:DNA-binding NtrC family response regulator